MNELRIATKMAGVNVIIVARRYVCEDTISFEFELEFVTTVSH